MKILCLSTWYPYPPDNGSRIRAFYLLRALAGAHEVTLVSFRPSQTRPNGGQDPALSDLYAVPIDPFRWVNLPQALKFLSPIPVAFWPSRAMRQTAARLARRSHCEAVVAIQTPAARYTDLWPKIPRILDLDTSLSYQLAEVYRREVSPARRVRQWVSWQKAYQYERRLLQAFDSCTVVSALEREYAAKLAGAGGCRVDVIPNGVDCQVNQPGWSKTVQPTLVYNGALTYDANYDAMRFFLQEVYPLARREVPTLQLTITGEIKGVDLAGLQLEPGVRLAGYVDDIRPVVGGATICIVPLRRGGGTRIKILEAMALGTPVVATSKGAEGLDVTPGRDLLIADEPAAFAACVVRLLQDAGLRQQLATQARRLVEEHYDWPTIGADFARLVEAVAARKRVRHDRN